MRIELSPQLEVELLRRVGTNGWRTPQDVLLAALRRLDAETPRLPLEPLPSLSDEEFHQLIDSLAFDNDTPVLPADFSRADIYDDHD